MSTLTTVAISMFLRCETDPCGAANDLGAMVDVARCRRCLDLQTVPAARWAALLDAAVHDLPRMGEGSVLTRDVEAAHGRVTATRAAAVCASCRAALPIDAIARGRAEGHAVCMRCDAKVLVRPVPGALASAVPGVTHLLGEDIAQVTNPDPSLPSPGADVTATCPSCGAGLPVEGKSRALRCGYCRNMVVLPGWIWTRLKGDSEPHTFYLVCDDAVPRASVERSLGWSCRRVAGDEKGNVYVAGRDDDVCEGGDPDVLLALDAGGRVRWSRRDLKHAEQADLAVRRDGTVLVWTSDRPAGRLVRTSDGGDAGKLGKEQPPNAGAHTLDLKDAKAVGFAPDGSALLLKENRLARCAEDGTAIPAWPAHKGLFGLVTVVGKTPPFTGSSESDAPSVAKLGDYPSLVEADGLVVGWDGATYVWQNAELASFDRAGKKRYALVLPSGVQAIGGDAAGHAYVLARSGDGVSVLKIAPGGAFERVFESDESDLPTDVFEFEELLVVGPDGSTILFGDDGRVVVLGADGRVVSQTAGRGE